jgi:uncharacterized protein YukE
MPSYQEVLDADPAEFEACGDEFEGAAAELSSGRERYRSHVDDTEEAWAGADHDRLREEASNLEDEAGRIERSLGDRAAILKTLGPALALAVETLQHTDRELRDAGYDVDSSPQVRPGGSATAPGPFGPALRALDEMMHRAVVVIDEVMAEALEAGELPTGRAQAILDEWEDIAEAADTIRGRLVETSSWDVPAPWAANGTAETALQIASRFAR